MSSGSGCVITIRKKIIIIKKLGSWNLTSHIGILPHGRKLVKSLVNAKKCFLLIAPFRAGFRIEIQPFFTAHLIRSCMLMLLTFYFYLSPIECPRLFFSAQINILMLRLWSKIHVEETRTEEMMKSRFGLLQGQVGRMDTILTLCKLNEN